MSTPKPEIREENKTLQEVYAEGLESGKWNSLSQAARMIDIPVPTFSGQYHGRSHGDTVKRTVAALRRKLRAKEHSVSELYEIGREKKKWKNVTECAKQLSVHRDSLAKYINMEEGTQLSPKGAAFKAKLIRLLKTKLGKLATQPSDPVDVRTDDTTMTESDWYNRLLAGVAEGTDQNLNGIRFVLTARNFRKLKGVITRQEVEDTKLLLQELRRRLNLMAQNDDEEIRGRCYRTLGREFDELLLAAQLLQEVMPTAAAAEMDRQREAFSQFHSSPEE